MNIKPYDLFLLEKKFLKEIKNTLNESIDTYQPLINSIIKENTIEGLKTILEKLDGYDNEEIYEFKFLDKLKSWGKRKLDLLQKKYKTLIDDETFAKVKEFIGSGNVPKTKREKEDLIEEDPGISKCFIYNSR
jgi:hypothetical protein